MRIVKDEAKIRRNARIAQITMLAGLAVLAAGMFISFRMPQLFSLSLVALFLGFALSQIGIYFSNRWGRSPRPDELLSQSLKGLDGKYTLYHYTTPVSHLLVGPAGIWVLLPRAQKGTISFSKGRWRQRGGNLYMKIFAQEGLGRPDIEVQGEIETAQKFLNKQLPEDTKLPEIQAALVFTNPSTVIDIDEDQETPAATIQSSKLKDMLRKSAKVKPLPMDKIHLIQGAIESTNKQVIASEEE